MTRLPQWVHVALALALTIGLSLPVLAADEAAKANPQADQQSAQGKVVSVSADQNQVVVRDQNGREWTFHVARDAKLHGTNNQEMKLADLKEGDQVTINYHMAANEVRSDRNAQGAELAQGRIKSLGADNNQFVLTDNNGKDWTFRADANARVRVNDKDGKLADLKAGDDAVIAYNRQGDQFQARDVEAERGAQARATSRGKVESVSADNHQLVLRDANGKERTFHLSRDAKVRINDKDGELADLKAGDQVTIVGRLTANEIREGQNRNEK